MPVKEVFLKEAHPMPNLKRNLQELCDQVHPQKNKNEEDLCEDLVKMLTDTVNGELKEKVARRTSFLRANWRNCRDALNESARRILKTK
ncbi:hypothetical protein NFI96_007453, partial [Prochilodus magdalenae]